MRQRLRTKWLIFRARFSTPVLLASHDEDKVTSALTAFNGGATILVLGAFAWLTELPLIFPALGPTAFILFSSPLSATAAPRSVVLGHLTALSVGFVAWHSTTWLASQTVCSTTGAWPVVISASLALALTCFLLVRLSLRHPPACASALVVALGAITELTEMLLAGLAVVIVTFVAVLINRAFPVPVTLWRAPRLTVLDQEVRPRDNTLQGTASMRSHWPGVLTGLESQW